MARGRTAQTDAKRGHGARCGSRRIEHAAGSGVPCRLSPRRANERRRQSSPRWYGEPAGRRMTVVGVIGNERQDDHKRIFSSKLLERCLGVSAWDHHSEHEGPATPFLPKLMHHARRADAPAASVARNGGRGLFHVVMEVSSRARAKGVPARSTSRSACSAITRNHLDYHGTMGNAERRVCSIMPRAAAVSSDDPWTPRLLRKCDLSVTRLSKQGLANVVGWDAHYCADRVSFTAMQRRSEAHSRDAAYSRGVLALQRAPPLAAAQASAFRSRTRREASLCQGVRGRTEINCRRTRTTPCSLITRTRPTG